MARGTMTSKGQITVPKDVRESLGLTAGTKVDFKLVDGRWTLSTEPARSAALAGILATTGRTLGLDDMDAAVAAGAGDLL
jgi:antitoxin PrlF